jgi:uncharacterized BrkB/YihY/UPF0761 family membrane protein
MNAVKRLIGAIDRWQQHNRIAGPAYAVIKKFGDDQANLYVVALGWYGFTAIYPLLLLVVTAFGYIGEASLGTGIVNTLRQFPVIGAQFKAGPGGSNLHGSALGLAVGLIGLLYGAQGVTETAQQAMAQVWNVPQYQLPGFLARLARSLLGLSIIGAAFLINALVGGIAAASGQTLILRLVLLAGLVAVNIASYAAAFWVLTPKAAQDRRFLPGAIVAGIGFTVLTTLGTGLVQHQLKHANDTYGAFASVIGVVTYLLLLAKLTMYAAELDPVLVRRLWPRALPTAPPTAADDQVLRDRAHQEQRRPDETIGVGFEPGAVDDAARDARAATGQEQAGTARTPKKPTGEDPAGAGYEPGPVGSAARDAWAARVRQIDRTDWSPRVEQRRGRESWRSI